MNESAKLVSPTAALAPVGEQTPTLSTGGRATSLTIVILHFLAGVAVILSPWGLSFSPVDLGLLLGGYALAALGVAYGYHRLCTPRSSVTNCAVANVSGSVRIEGVPLEKDTVAFQSHFVPGGVCLRNQTGELIVQPGRPEALFETLEEARNELDWLEMVRQRQQSNGAKDLVGMSRSIVAGDWNAGKDRPPGEVRSALAGQDLGATGATSVDPKFRVPR